MSDNLKDGKIFPSAEKMLNKVPEITIFFWIIKVLCTTVGETASDFLNVNMNLGLTGTSIITGILLAIVLFFQFKAKRYVPGLYWLTVVLISVFGTLVTDNLTDAMNVPLELSTIIFTVLLMATFAIWYAKEKTLSVHSIVTKQREFFYWLIILFTFALGTATGDLMAESLGLGYALTGLIVIGVVSAVTIAWRMGLNAILAFWIVYIMTRPLGASLGDYLSQSPKYGGLGLGATMTSVIFLLAILATVIFLTITKKDLIIKKPVEEKVDGNQIGVGWQVAMTALALVLVFGTGYHWRRGVLAAQAQSAISQEAIQVESADATNQTAAAIGQVSQTVKANPLGDVSNFQKITGDMLDMVNAGNLSAAKTRADDLESEWDNSQSKLKPMNGAKWTEVDNAIDKVLRQVRSVSPDAAGCKSSLEALLVTLN